MGSNTDKRFGKQPLSVRIERHSIPEPNSGCRLWLGAVARGNKKREGYGIITVGAKSQRGTDRVMSSHRAAYQAYKGPIPAGSHVLHSCDNTLCVNPDHLFLGTHQDNVADMDAKGRRVKHKGQSNSNAKIDEAVAAEVKRLKASGLPIRLAADTLGISHHIVRSIYGGWAWVDVPAAHAPLGRRQTRGCEDGNI